MIARVTTSVAGCSLFDRRPHCWPVRVRWIHSPPWSPRSAYLVPLNRWIRRRANRWGSRISPAACRSPRALEQHGCCFCRLRAARHSAIRSLACAPAYKRELHRSSGLSRPSSARSSLVALAAWTGDQRPPRVRSLVADGAHLIASDAEMVCALAAAASDHDLLLHLRWTEVLGRDAAFTRRFYRELEERVTILGDASSYSLPADERRSHRAAVHLATSLSRLSRGQRDGWMSDADSLASGSIVAC